METQSQKDKKSVPELFRDAWSQALSAVSSAEDEAHRALTRVSDLAGWGQDEVRRHTREFADRLVGQRREVEKSIDQGVRRALARTKPPRREEVEALTQRVDALGVRIDRLVARRRSAK
jgi:hypothetical protein